MNKMYVLLFLILANLFWAGNYVLGKYVVEELSPLQMTFSRWFIALFLLFPIAHWVERPHWKSVWKEWKVLSLAGLLGIIAFNFLLYEALQYTTSMNAALISSINPVIIVLFSSLLLKERIPLRNGIGLLISLLGVLLVLTQGKLLQVFHMNFNQGDLFVLLAILVWTFYSILGKNMKGIPPISATAVSAVFGLLMMLPFVMVSGIPYPLSNQSMIGLLYFGIFPSVASFIFWNVALRHTDASRAGIYLNLIPVFTAVINLTLGKTINFIQVVGGIFVFIGVYLTSKKRRKNNEGSLAARSLREAEEQSEIEVAEEKHAITHQ